MVTQPVQASFAAAITPKQDSNIKPKEEAPKAAQESASEESSTAVGAADTQRRTLAEA